MPIGWCIPCYILLYAIQHILIYTIIHTSILILIYTPILYTHINIYATLQVLRPHFRDMEYKLRPGMITLTWTSMNIDTYKTHIQTGLKKLDELVININDLIENRIEKNLKLISRTMLVDLPTDITYTIDDFIKIQEQYIIQQ